jgi:diadenosine tetraphosphatase ApaH/serine/threonine PP2A family protein phosphatase
VNPVAIIRGNHDKAACGIEDGSNFNQVARLAALWTLETLTPDNRRYLKELPAGPEAIDDLVEICHGSPFDEDHYIFDGEDALHALSSSGRPVCLFGHTHLPVVFHCEKEIFDGFVPEDEETTIDLGPNARYLVNAGSVGQPRDGDPRAAYGVYDSTARALHLKRVVYPVDAASGILSAGLPASRANRLAVWRTGDGSGRRVPASYLFALSFPPLQLHRHASAAARDPSTHPMTMPTSSTAGMNMKCADVISPITAGLRQPHAG